MKLFKTESGENKNAYLTMLGVLGVVYGDIGTSPLYALKISLNNINSLNRYDILSIVSIMCWLLFIVISVKYILFILKADNQGEGGAFALLELATAKRKGKLKVFLLTLGLLGACLFYGDSMITPAISILSALEGIEVISPTVSHWVIPISIVIIIALFILQSRGTHTIGKVFGPIMFLWFLILTLLGLTNIIHDPSILEALNPYHAIRFIAHHELLSFILLSVIVLTVTGAEALYADMGHFNRKAIQRTWTFYVLPALIICYLGQGALLINHPEAIENPFYYLAPEILRIPLLILATFATIIASQAVLSGCFSLTAQAINLGYLPKMNVIYTSADVKGHVYIPMINRIVGACVIIIVLAFKNSDNLAHAYGIAVTGSMFITTFLAFFALLKRYHGIKKILLFTALTIFLIIDALLFSSNSLKFFEGGWLPIFIALFSFFLMHTWIKGQNLISQAMRKDNRLVQNYMLTLYESGNFTRVDRCAIYLTAFYNHVPVALLQNLKHNKVLHESNLFITLTSSNDPYVPLSKGINIVSLGHKDWLIEIKSGYKDMPNLPNIIAYMQGKFPDLELDKRPISFFLSRLQLIMKEHQLNYFERNIFHTMMQMSVRSTRFYRLPPDEVIAISYQLEI